MEQTVLPTAPAVERLPLTGGQELVLERRAASSLLHVVSADGRVGLSIEVTADGPVLRLDGANLKIQVSGDLALEAGRLALHGHDGLSLSSGGDLCLQADGKLHSAAREQHIEGVEGDVKVKANDFLKLQGELIKLNC